MPNAAPSAEASSGRWFRVYLLFEFALLFLILPVVLYLGRVAFSRWIIPTLVVMGVLCTVLLLRDPSFDRRRLWNTTRFFAHLRHTLRWFVPWAFLLGLFVFGFRPDLLFAFPRENPRLWLVVMGFYPVFSVYPQEIIYRTFLFHRYRSLFPHPTLRIGVSGVAFGLAHLLFANWLAPVLTTLGGFLFARTYARSGSTLQAGLEHGLWGDFIFTIGLGWYFYGGSIRATEALGWVF